MKTRFIAICLLLIAAVVAVTWYHWPVLPAQIPVHWNHAGQADDYAPRMVLWLLGPGLMTFFMVLALALPYLSPRRFDMSTFEATYLYSMGVVVAMLAYVHLLVLIAATGGQVPLDRALPAGVFVMMILLGNPMGKVRKNFYLGIRTPWTLSSDRVWYATHRLAARLMVGSGVAGFIGVLVGAPGWMSVFFALWWAPVAVMFSLACYKRLEKSGNLEPH